MKKGNGEMAWILRIFGFYAFWALLWRAPSSGLAHRATDVCGYSGGYMCPARNFLITENPLLGLKGDLRADSRKVHIPSTLSIAFRVPVIDAFASGNIRIFRS